MRFCNGYNKETVSVHKFLCKSQKKSKRNPDMIGQAFMKESMSHTRLFEWNDWFRAGRISIEGNQHTAKQIGSTTPDTAAKLQQLICEDQR
jgi:hypothetical protein